MKKGYYIHFQGRSSIGISKKIDMQLEEFSKYYEMEELEVETLKRTLLQRIFGLFPTASITRDYSKALEKLENPDFIYVRRTVADRKYLKFWKNIKEKYPDCKIIIEIFTYPYDKDDFAKWNAWPFYIKELIYRRNLKKYIDRFVTYTDDKEIFGVPTIRTTNGVNVEKIDILKGEWEDNKITLIGVAYMQRQHGYERVIEGMKEYYQNFSGKYYIYLNLVGDGPEKKKYQSLADQYNLKKYITFYPNTSGKALDALYNQSDIALVGFGTYKVGFYGKTGAIKSREYMAKGIPMISGVPIAALENYKYVKLFPNDNTPVDMMEVIKLYELMRADEKNKISLASKIRKYAIDTVNMPIVMKPIMEYIEK